MTFNKYGKKIHTSKGDLSAILSVPELEKGEKCPLAILMHGFMANKRLEPLRSVAKALQTERIATLRFDFDGHGGSYGKFYEMTVETELFDAESVLEYAKGLDFVSDIALVGHSQGGVVAGMIAGKHSSEIKCIVQLAAAAVLRDDAIQGVLMGKHYDPENLPEYLKVFFHKVGRKYFSVAQSLPIFEVSSSYKGPVLLIHGKKDEIVPYSYSERYDKEYSDCRLCLLEQENHLFSKCRKEVVAMTVDFLKDNLLKH